MGCGASAQKPPPDVQQPTVKVQQADGGGGGIPAASSPASSVLSKPLEPLPILADNAHRLVISDQLYKLNPVWADKLLAGETSLPMQAGQIISWRRAKWELWEEDDGLQLLLSSRAASDKKKLVTWTGFPENVMKVEELPTLSVEGKTNHHAKKLKSVDGVHDVVTHPDDAVKVEVIDIPEEHKEDPKELTPFVIKWEVDGRKKCFVIGCEDESSCGKWVANLTLYSNIDRRHCGAVMWKLNQSFYSDLPENWRETQRANEELGDLNNWRRRLCYMEQLKSHKALCITYISEKSDAEECVANVLASIIGDNVKAVATVRRLPGIGCKELTGKAAEKVSMSVQQYDIAVANQGHNDLSEVRLPSMLHGFEVRQSDDTDGIGQAGNVFAFEDAIMCERFLAAIEAAGAKLTKNTDLPPLKIVQR